MPNETIQQLPVCKQSADFHTGKQTDFRSLQTKLRRFYHNKINVLIVITIVFN